MTICMFQIIHSREVQLWVTVQRRHTHTQYEKVFYTSELCNNDNKQKLKIRFTVVTQLKNKNKC